MAATHELSAKSKYFLSKHRGYELRHFCLQYPEWENKYLLFDNITNFTGTSICTDTKIETSNIQNIPEQITLKKNMYLEKMKMDEQAAIAADDVLYPYILKAVTEDLSYTYLDMAMNIPCGREKYYKIQRKFFWELDKLRN